MAFVGLASSAAPLVHFIVNVVDFTDKRPFWLMEGFFLISLFFALVLQVFGILPLHKISGYFRFTLCASFLVINILLIRESRNEDNIHAKHFIIPMLILLISGTIATLHEFYGTTIINFPIFQIGVALFMLAMGIIASMSVKNSIDLKKQER